MEHFVVAKGGIEFAAVRLAEPAALCGVGYCRAGWCFVLAGGEIDHAFRSFDAMVRGGFKFVREGE